MNGGCRRSKTTPRQVRDSISSFFFLARGKALPQTHHARHEEKEERKEGRNKKEGRKQGQGVKGPRAQDKAQSSSSAARLLKRAKCAIFPSEEKAAGTKGSVRRETAGSGSPEVRDKGARLCARYTLPPLLLLYVSINSSWCMVRDFGRLSLSYASPLPADTAPRSRSMVAGLEAP